MRSPSRQYACGERSHESRLAPPPPCSNEFGGQEPGTASEIKEFTRKLGVTFPVFSKVKVNGGQSHPLFQFLKSGTKFLPTIKWNFTKFLVSKEGHVISRHSPMVSPKSLAEEIERYL